MNSGPPPMSIWTGIFFGLGFLGKAETFDKNLRN